MNSNDPLGGAHLRTYETIFQHPLSHNLHWREVRALLSEIGQINEEHNGHLKVTRNGHILLLHRSHSKDVADARELMTLRHFLKQSEAATPAGGAEAHWLLVIDHQQARIFRCDIAGVPILKVLPHEPEGHMHTMHDEINVARGKENPDANSFFKLVAEALQGAGQILLFGTGTGTSSEMEQFIAWSKTHHPELAKRIIGSVAVDEHHLTNDQLLAKAREFYAQAPLREKAEADQKINRGKN